MVREATVSDQQSKAVSSAALETLPAAVSLREELDAVGISDVLAQLDRELIGLKPVKTRIREISSQRNCCGKWISGCNTHCVALLIRHCRLAILRIKSSPLSQRQNGKGFQATRRIREEMRNGLVSVLLTD